MEHEEDEIASSDAQIMVERRNEFAGMELHPVRRSQPQPNKDGPGV